MMTLVLDSGVQTVASLIGLDELFQTFLVLDLVSALSILSFNRFSPVVVLVLDGQHSYSLEQVLDSSSLLLMYLYFGLSCKGVRDQSVQYFKCSLLILIGLQPPGPHLPLP